MAKSEKFNVLIAMVDGVSPTMKRMVRAVKGFQKVMKGLRNTVQRITKPFKSIFAALTGIGALAGVFFLVGKALRHTVNRMLEAEQAAAKLTGVLKATGFAAGLTAGSLQEMGERMVKATTFTGEQVQEAQAILLTFTQVHKDLFEETLQMGGDMSALFGQQLKQSMIQLGTAMNDPIRGVGRLRRIGISFNEAQKSTIKLLESQGKRMEAQRVILDELQREIGGAAEELSKTMGGALKQTIGFFHSLFGRIGQVVGMLPAFRKFIFDLRDSMGTLSSGGQGAMIALIKKIFDVSRSMLEFMKVIVTKVQPTFKILVDVLGRIIVVLKVLWDIVKTVAVAFRLFGKLIGGVVTFVAEIIAGLIFNWRDGFEGLKLVMQNFADFWKNLGLKISSGAQDMAAKVVRSIATIIARAEGMLSTLRGVKGFEWLPDLSGTVKATADLAQNLEDTATANRNMLTMNKEIQRQRGEKAKQLFSGMFDFTESSAQFEKAWEQAEQGFSQIFEDGAFNYEKYQEDFQKFINALGINVDMTEVLSKALEDLNETERKLIEIYHTQAEADKKQKTFVEDLNKSIDGIKHPFEKFSFMLKSAGFENMTELGANIATGILDGGLRELFADLASKMSANMVGAAVEQAIVKAYTATAVEGVLGGMAKDATEEQIKIATDRAALQAGTTVGPFAGLMGGLAGGLIGGLVGKLFNKKPKVPKKPVPVKVVNWGDMTAQLLKASSRRAVSPMITSGNNMGLSRTFDRDVNF
jgi:hypothetical protein